MRRVLESFILLLAALPALAQPPGGGAGDGIWRRNAFWGEAQTFDACVGHQPQTGEYHHHANPLCLRAQLNDNLETVRNARTGTTYREKAGPWTHSPILGWALDGYPIYGPYGYSDAKDPASPVKRVKSGYRPRTITERVSLPEWALTDHPGVAQQLTAAQYGPPISQRFPLGRYNEDFEWVTGIGDLDQHNGRFAVTPEFPQGTYAYHVTIDDNGQPAFPYILGGQYKGAPSAGRAPNIAGAVEEYFSSVAGANAATASGSPSLASWFTRDSSEPAKAVTGYDPSAGPSTTWPTNVPTGARVSGGVTTPANANVQRVRFTEASVYVNANGLASYTMGPWFDPTMTGGVFSNFPSNRGYQYQFPRTPAESATKTSAGLGAIGMWVNGVAIFNFLDGGSHSIARSTDVGGGTVTDTAVQVSSASGENGPAAPGSLITANSLFGTVMGTATEAVAPGAAWPIALAGTSVAVRDAQGVTRPAPLAFVSPTQVKFQVPAETAAGFATVAYSVGSSSFNSGLYVVPSYPHLFPEAALDGATLAIRGSGLGNAATVKATAGGMEANVVSAKSSATEPGIDEYRLELPAAVNRPGAVEVIITAAGKPSNAITIELP